MRTGLIEASWVTRYSASGLPYQVWESTVPAIDPNVLQCVFYVYPSRDAAEAGKAAGGTGFLAGVPLEINSYVNQLYAVTNRHVITHCGSEVVLRVNQANGRRDFISTRNRDWIFHPDGLDVAVHPVVLSPDYQYNFVGTSLFFLTPQIVRVRRIGPGDDVFMVGRFVGQDGTHGNLPTARFGHIGRMNAEPIKDGDGVEQDSFLVEMRSIPGYSGSPIFVYINPTLARPPSFMTPHMHQYNQAQHGPWLLGIDWSHLTSFRPVLNSNKRDKADPPQWVEINSGMAGVIPAWRIQELLDLPELVMQRKEQDKHISEMQQEGSASLDGAEPEEFTQSDFEQALRKVSRRVETSQSDEEKK
jgi:trypsin-like peptidase